MAGELKRKFSNVEEAFRSLPEKEQEHSIRVGEYLRVMFLQACSLELYAFNQKATVRLKEDYADLMPVIGRYHDVGKAQVAEVYHTYQPAFTPEETALYRRHAMDSANLARQLLDDEKRYTSKELNFIAEAIADHHEQWNGEGFPEGRKGENISIFARILAVSNALDHYAVGKRSEQPLEYALERLKGEAGTLFDPQIVEMMLGMKGKLKRIFNAHIAQTRAIPVTETIIRRSGGRPMELWYRPILERKKESSAAFEAFIRFRNKKDWLDYPAMDEALRREKMVPELGVYMMLEACDMLSRLDVCGIPAEMIVLELPSGWLNRRGAWRDLQQVLTDTEITPKRLCIDLGERTMSARTTTMLDNLEKIRELGCSILLTAVDPEKLDRQEMKTLSVTAIRVTTELLEGEKAEAITKALQDLTVGGIDILAQNVVKKRHIPTLNKLKARYAVDTLGSDLFREDDLVERELALQEGELPPAPKAAPAAEAAAETAPAGEADAAEIAEAAEE